MTTSSSTLTIREALKLAEASAAGAIAYQRGERCESPVAVPKTQLLGGFKVPALPASLNKVTPKAQALFAKMNREASDAAVLKTRLAKHGLEPLAVLPTTVWDTMANRAGLFRMTPDEDKVAFKAKPVLAIAKAAANVQIEAAEKRRGTLHSITSAVLSLIVFGPFAVSIHVIAGLMAMTAFLFIWLLFTESQRRLSPEEREQMELEAIRALVAKHQAAGTLPSLLWPKLVEPTSGKVVRIDLPPAPPEVQEVLRKAAHVGLPLQVATVSEAIQFKDDLVALLTKERAKQLEAERLAAEAAALDPIIFVQQGSATAILAQFGEFAVEQQLVEEAVRDGLFAGV